MVSPTYPTVADTAVSGPVVAGSTCCGSAVSWPAIIAGAVIATAVSLALLILGSSFGLAVASPWSTDEMSATTITAAAIIWLVLMQWISAAFGGYITGRMRVRWTTVNRDEVFFRDTAHGFITWSVATLFTAAFLTSAAACVIKTGAEAGAAVTAGAAVASQVSGDENRGDRPSAAEMVFNDAITYNVDSLYRAPADVTQTSTADTRAETMRIVMHALKNDAFPAEDRAALSQSVMRHTGLSQAEADARVDQIITNVEAAKVEAKETADKVRKTSASIAIFTFASMLIGAFIASVAAALGGRCRDMC